MRRARISRGSKAGARGRRPRIRTRGSARAVYGRLVVAWHNGANAHHVDQLAIAFVAIRIVYALMYVLDWAALRSLVWFAGMACVVALFFAAP
jgi:uncharacterized MAPEG superfamily protein